MILYRIATAFRRQDWPTVGLEIIIVVLGVFLGLQASNWNDDLENKRTASEYLQRLQTDFRFEGELYARVVDYYGVAHAHGVRALVAFAQPPETLDSGF